jgi:hypothetical protein
MSDNKYQHCHIFAELLGQNAVEPIDYDLDELWGDSILGGCEQLQNLEDAIAGEEAQGLDVGGDVVKHAGGGREERRRASEVRDDGICDDLHQQIRVGAPVDGLTPGERRSERR